MRRRAMAGVVGLATAAAALAGCGSDPSALEPRAGPAAARQVGGDQPGPGGLAAGKRPPQRSGVVRAAVASARAMGPQALGVQSFAAVRDIGPNVFASPFVTPAPQNEPAIAVSPRNSARLAASSNDYRLGSPQCGTYASTDGGASWQDIGPGVLPLAAGFTSGGDPSVTFGPGGTAYFTCLEFNGFTGASAIVVGRSIDLRSAELLTPVVADTAGSLFFNDKPYTAFDTNPASPYRGRIYVTWTRFASTPTGEFAGSPIYIASSTDRGRSWSTPRPVAPAGFSASQGAVPAVGPNGELYVAFENFNTVGEVNQVLVSRSLDGGRTFGTPVRAADVYDICPRVVFNSCSLRNSFFRVNSFPSVAVDPRRGHVFVTWGDYRLGSAKAFIVRSTSRGERWGPEQAVSNESPNDQVFPWVAATPDGAPNVVYYDRRDDPNNFFLSVYVSTGRGGGLRFEPAVRVSSGPSNPDVQFSGSFIGDYIGMAATAGRLNPIWTDTRRLVLSFPAQAAVTSPVYLTAGRAAALLASR